MHLSITDLIILYSWMALTVLLILATVICAIVACCLKDKARLVAVDTLLVLATIVVVVFNAAVFLPKSINHGAAADSAKFNYRKKADLVALDLQGSSFLKRLDSPWKEIAAVENAWTSEKAYKESEGVVSLLLKEHPADSALIGRLAIILHEAGGNWKEEAFEKYGLAKDDGFLASLRQLYSDDNSESSANALFLEAITNELPEGWFRNAVLKQYYKKTSNQPALAKIDAEENQLSSTWGNKYKAIKIVSTVLFLLGGAGIFRFMQTWSKTVLPEIPQYGFRKAYGFFLANLYSQCVAGLIVGLGIGIAAGSMAALHHSKFVLPNYSSLLTQASIISGTIATTLCFYLFACRPRKVSLKAALFADSRVKSLGEGCLYAFLGFCAAVFSSFLIHLVMSQVVSAGNTTEAMLQLLDSVMTTNIWGLLWSAFWFCILAPFTEELLLRVMFYPWLRHKLGIALAVIVSSSFFSLIHLNLPFFFHYFAIGAILALVYEKTRSFPIIVAIHGLWNAWVILEVSLMLPR